MSPETREKEGRQSQSESLSPSLFAGLLCVSASLLYLWASLVAQTVKNLPAMQETRFDPWVRKIPWRREWQPTLVFLPGEFHGQRSLVSYRPLGHKESYMTEQLTHTHTHTLCSYFLWPSQLYSSTSQGRNDVSGKTPPEVKILHLQTSSLSYF